MSNGKSFKEDPASVQPTAWACMLTVRRWLVWRDEQGRKVPYYVNGTTRGKTDCPDDWNQLASNQEASAVASGYSGLAFALGPDGTGWHWQGIDLDDVQQNQLSGLANDLPGYVEVSPSGNGCHAIGCGQHFATLGSNGTGIEAYASGRYFTVTGDKIRDGAPCDLSKWVTEHLVARHQRQAGGSPPGTHPPVPADAKTVSHLRSALNAIPAGDYHTWVRMGCALYELGDTGRELWLSWSQQSAKWKPQDARKWETFRADRTGFASVFAEAQRHGWLNPNSNAAQVEAPAHGKFDFSFADHGESPLDIQYIAEIDPWLPRATVIGCYGRGEAGKSSWTAQICAAASSEVSTLWISSEERQDHIKQRHLSCGGEPGTLAVPVVIPTRLDPVTKKPTATSFNIFEHMEPAIVSFQKDPKRQANRPLRIVVLDAVVTLVTWSKGENANDDGAVKRLVAHLFTLSERFDITFVMLGHLNKSTNREHIADTVTGSAAWTNSVRLAYMFAKNLESDNYEGFVRTVKSNTGTPFGATYKTVPVYVLRQRSDGHHDVLCGVEMVGQMVWGERALRELMATDEEGERRLAAREEREEAIQAIVTATLNALESGPTTRTQVEVTLGKKPSKRHWIAADVKLKSQGVYWMNGEHGVRLYNPGRKK